MHGKIFISLLIISSIVLSCGKRELNRNDYIRYVESADNGLYKDVEIDGWEYKIQYRPYDYILLHEWTTAPSSSEKTERMKQLEGTAWFNITLKRKDGSAGPLRYQVASLEEYNQRYNYYLTAASSAIRLLYGNDTLRPMSYVFESSYNLAPEEVMVVGFELPKGNEQPRKDMLLSYHDRVFNNGIINVRFSEKNLLAIPQLND